MIKSNNKNQYEQYKSEHRREKNKIKKLRRYLKSHPNDYQAEKDIERLQNLIK